MKSFIPYLIAICGVVLDWVTTHIGLGLGFYETHSNYTPVNALLIFIGVLVLMQILLGKFKYKWQYQSIVACVSFLGFLNNTLVLLGLSGGWIL